MMQRTMIPAGQNESGQPQFTTPEKAIYDRNKIKMQQQYYENVGGDQGISGGAEISMNADPSDG